MTVLLILFRAMVIRSSDLTGQIVVVFFTFESCGDEAAVVNCLHIDAIDLRVALLTLSYDFNYIRLHCFNHFVHFDTIHGPHLIHSGGFHGGRILLLYAGFLVRRLPGNC